MIRISLCPNQTSGLPPILGKAAVAAAAASDFSYENALNAAVGEDPIIDGAREASAQSIPPKQEL